MRLHGQESLKVSQQPTKFGGDRHFGSEDIMVLVSLVILEDHVIKGSCDFVCKSPPTKVEPSKSPPTIQLSLVALETAVLEI